MSAVLLVGPIPQLYCSLLVGMFRVQTPMAIEEWMQFLHYFFLSVSMCAGVSGNRPRQECVAPPTAAAPQVRGHPPGDMGYGMYYCTVCMCMCIYACVCVYIHVYTLFDALHNCFYCESLAVAPCHAPPAKCSENCTLTLDQYWCLSWWGGERAGSPIEWRSLVATQ